MHEKNELIVSLLYKSTDGQELTEMEKYDLEQWRSESEYNSILYNEVMDLPALKAEIQAVLKNYDTAVQWERIRSQLSRKNDIVPADTDQ